MQKPDKPQGWLVIHRNLNSGEDSVLINGNLLISVSKINGKQLKLAFKDLDPNVRNRVERYEKYQCKKD